MNAVLTRCSQIAEGLRAKEASVEITTLDGKKVYLRTNRKLLVERDGASYIEIGVIHRDHDAGAWLIELPHEADSGENRVWVANENIWIYDRSLYSIPAEAIA